MSEIILAVGAMGIGVSAGYMLGLLTKRFITPTVKQLQQAMAVQEDSYKTMLGRLKRRIAEYEQPSELQNLAIQTRGVDPTNIISMLANELPNIKNIPRWLRPFIPALQSYVKENPEQVQALLEKFLTPKTQSLGAQEGL